MNAMASMFSDESTFNQLLKEILKTKVITDDQIEMLAKVFGERFTNAYKMVETGWVKKYLFLPSGR